MPAPTLQYFIARNEEYSHEHKPFPTFKEGLEMGYTGPKTAIICCADPHSNPDHFLKLKGEAVVLRTTRGKVENTLEPVISVDSLLHFENIIVIQHTDCGATTFRDGEIKKGLKELAPDHSHEIDQLHFRDTTGALQESVRDSMNFLRESSFLRPELKKNIAGFVYDIKTGKLNPV